MNAPAKSFDSQSPFALHQTPGYHALGAAFFTAMPAEAVTTDPVTLHASADAARLIGLPEFAMAHPDFARVFSGLQPLPGFEPLAMVYSGHQFGVWAGQLGDGRALTIGQIEGPDGPWDIQLKGAGRTPYSRFGDGRAVVRSSIREYLCSEAMAALGVPTTRALCVIATRRPVRRESIEPGAVVTRLMRSNIRFGHFEHFHHNGDKARVRQLADFVIDRHHPELSGAGERHGDWFALIVRRTASLMARWQALGFAHGVMNTDNMSILGDTLDYGPFGFLDAFEPGFICNHSDEFGRYAFDRQPGIALWNLNALAVALSSLAPWGSFESALKSFVPAFVAEYSDLMRAKLGLEGNNPADEARVTDLLSLMKRAGADYASSFRMLSATHLPEGREAWLSLFGGGRPEAVAWLDGWLDRVGTAHEARVARMNAVNPRFVLRNWVAETAIRAVEDHGDVATLDRIFRLVTRPFDEHAPEDAAFAGPPPPQLADLCVSCSS